MAKNNSTKPEKIEAQLFKAADKLRKNIDAAEYKHIVLGLIFLKYISDSFEELHTKLKEGKGKFEGADPEDQDEYKAENVFWVPKNARWSYLHSRAKLPTIGKDLDDAMELIEKENPTLKGILPKVFAKPNLDKSALGGLIDLIGNIALGDEAAKSKDILGKVYEYFLGEFALAEGKKGGQFYTPKSIVKLLIEMIEPYKGRVYDPCCGSGGMFVMSEKFVQEHQGRIDDISIYGQESNQTTYRLARMNLAIRGIDGSQVKWNNEGSFLKDAHPDLKADYILANPPFNDSDWSGELLQNDGRWKYGVPPAGNANFAWIQHFIYHLAPNGIAAFLLGNAGVSSVSNNEDNIRENIVKNDMVDCIVSLPNKLFYNTQLPVTVWIINRNKNEYNGFSERKGKVLFIDCEEFGYFTDKQHRFFTEDDINEIATIYKSWRKGLPAYSDIPGLCKEVTLNEIAEKNYSLVPKRYIESRNVNKKEALLKELFLKLGSKTQDSEELTSNLAVQIKEISNLINISYEEVPISKYCNLELGGDWGKESKFENSKTAYSLRGVDLSNLRNNGRSDIPKRFLKENSLQKRALDEQDIIIGGSGVGPIGKTLWVNKYILQSLDQPLTFSNFCKRLRCESPEIAVFMEGVLTSLYEEGIMSQYFTGTSIPNLDVHSLLTHKVKLPSKEVIESIGHALKNLAYIKVIKSGEFEILSNLQKEIILKISNGYDQ
jgi:type I restriction enzyme M protein